MRNHIIFKFIAVLLCAVSLLGALGSAAGLFVMTELDLYSKTVDQLKAERVQENSKLQAELFALRYASSALGSCPEEILARHYGLRYNPPKDETYRYTLLDAEGNVLSTLGEVSEVAETFRYPVSGQYLHLVSMETASQKERRLQSQAIAYTVTFTVGDTPVILDALAPEGAHIAYASFCDINGKVLYELYNDSGVGFLYYNKDGHVTFSGSRFWEEPIPESQRVAGAHFQSADGSVVYHATAKDGVGLFSVNSSGLASFTAGITEADIPVATEEPVVEETQPLPTEPEEEPEPTDILPVFYAAFYNEEDEKFYRVRSGNGVGFLSLNEKGQLVFRGVQFESTQLPEDITITGTYFCDIEDRVVFELYADENIGTISYTPNNQLIFTTAEPVTDFDPSDPLKDQEDSSASDIPDVTEETAATEYAETTAPAATAAAESTEATAPAEPTEAAEPVAVIAAEKPVPSAIEFTPPTAINGKPLEEYYVEKEEYYDNTLSEQVFVGYVRAPMPEYTVEVQLAPGVLGMDSEYQLLSMICSISGYLLPALGICVLVFAICAVYLCCAAGHKPRSEEIRASGLNRMSLDLYALLVLGGICAACAIAIEIGWDRLDQNFLFSCALMAAMAFVICLLLVAFFFAFAAQVKTPGSFWWHNSLCGRFIHLWFLFAKWVQKVLFGRVFPVFGKFFVWLWNDVALGFFRMWQRLANWTLRVIRRSFRSLRHSIHRFLSLLPITWQWLLAGLVIIFVAALTLGSHNGSTVILGLLAIIAIILYCAHCFGVLSESAKRMSRGDLDIKVDDNLMVGCFKDFAGDLNNLADVAVVAAQQQLKSERMKTELITNVSHDIKTPLTSIINYVDLLQKTHDEAEQTQYLEVLDRQSQRLKKLIEDLMDMSKASTGNMIVEITTIDAVESVNQALGEFSDKLNMARLTPMFRHPENRVSMRADGRLVWRVLSNVLSNAVKYAMPGTRLYVDLMELEGKVVISLKNISREELNMDADELMERFVRGDDSRNTDGSGLGLNIAKSLMELQKGQLQLLVDGDLFKVTLIFPGK